MELDADFPSDYQEILSELYPSEINISPDEIKTSLVTSDSVKDLDWHFNEQFQELSAVTEVQPLEEEAEMTNFNVNIQPASNAAPNNFMSDDVPEILDAAFKVLDETFPEDVFNCLTETAACGYQQTNDMFAELVPSTVSEAAKDFQQHTERLVKVTSTKLKLRKRSTTADIDNSPAVSKLPKLELSTLAVNRKSNESEQQAVRRVKNNFASKVFRFKRKSKLENMMAEKEELTRQNNSLRRDVALVEEVVGLLKQGLIANCNARKQ